MFIESASKEDLATVTNEVDITVVKTENNEWKVKSDDTFADALLGGLITAGEELSKAFENQE